MSNKTLNKLHNKEKLHSADSDVSVSLSSSIKANDFFKALGDSTRLSLVIALREKQSMCVCDLTQLLKQPQPTISRHLNHLQRIGILIKERKGTWIWYGINPNMPTWCLQVIHLIET